MFQRLLQRWRQSKNMTAFEVAEKVKVGSRVPLWQHHAHEHNKAVFPLLWGQQK